MIRSLRWYFLILTICSLYLLACENTGTADQSSYPTVPVTIERFDQQFADQAELSLEDLHSFVSENPLYQNAIADIYIHELMEFKNRRDSSNQFVNKIHDFLQNEAIVKLQHEIDSVYEDLDKVEKDLSVALFQFQKIFNTSYVPKVYAINSAFGYGAFVFSEKNGQDAIGLGLDMFLGKTYPYKKYFPTNPTFSDYLTERFEEGFMAKKAIDALLESIVPPSRKNAMLDWMIRNGKVAYLRQKMLPHQPLSELFEFSKSEMEWCEENEIEIWSFFASEELLYSEDQLKFQKYISPAPESPGMPNEAPDRTGNYIGYRIVDSYMKRNPSTSIEDLLAPKDGIDFLKASKFKPGI